MSSMIFTALAKETAKELGIAAERVDEQIYREGMLERIYRQIEAADIIIADMKGKNPNVFYEVGYAHAKGQLCIHLTAGASDIPFDLKHRYHIVHGGSITNLREQLTPVLTWAKNEVENVRRSHIKVSVRTWGHLDRTEYVASGEIEFTVDLKNDSDKTSPDIESVYFYSTRGWTLKQDSRLCPFTDSSIPGFGRMQFIAPPVRRLSRAGWAQMKFSASKLLAIARKGEELKDSYRVTGRSVLRLVTADGNFDHKLPIDVEVHDVPF